MVNKSTNTRKSNTGTKSVNFSKRCSNLKDKESINFEDLGNLQKENDNLYNI